MALLFNGSAPQSMKDKRLYDDDTKFTDDDLQDVLDGLLKLGLSTNNNRKKHALRSISRDSIRPFTMITKPKSAKLCTNTNKSPNRHNPLYQEEPSFIANCRSLRQKKEKQESTLSDGINLLFEAAKKVEGRSSFFKMDINDIDLSTNSIRFEDIKHEMTYNPDTGILKKKSKNGISPPHAMDLNESFIPLDNTHNIDSLRLSEISSIGRRSSILSPNNKQQQQENRRIYREWSNRNIQEMDTMYEDKTKLAQKQQMEQRQEHVSKARNLDLQSLSNASKSICVEFSESNHELHSVIDNHKDNMDKIRKYHKKHRCDERERQNQILKRQLKRMEHKIIEQQRKEEEIAKRRAQQQQEQKQTQIAQQQQQQNQIQIAQQKQQQKQQKQIQIAQQQQQQKQIQIAQQKQQKQKQKQIQIQKEAQEQKEWYPHHDALCAVHKHYKAMLKQCQELVVRFEASSTDLQCDLEMHLGLIVRSISSNQKSVFDAFRRFQKLVNNKTGANSNERRYCFIKITSQIIADVRIIKSSAQKFASAYFLSFAMNEYTDEYIDIFKSMFYGQCVWTVPYIDKQLRNLSIKQRDFDPNAPSIVRCVLLQYHAVKDLKSVPSEKRVYLQSFAKNNNAGAAIFEAENTYFDRMQGICGLLAAFMSIRDSNEFKNPFGIDSSHCWKWVVSLLSLPQCVYPELCSILSSIIQIIGHDMLQKYPKQFPKIIKFIHFNIFGHSDESTTTRGKARRELNLFLRECQQSMNQNNGRIVIKKPQESTLIAETVGASALTNIRGSRGRGRGR